MSKLDDAIAAAEAREQTDATKERASKNRAAWPVAMHTEKGELKEDLPIGED